MTPELIAELRERHNADGGDAINAKIDAVFECFPDNTCPYDVQIKVAVLNTLYNTAIQYIQPVVDKINTVFSKVKAGEVIVDDPIFLVDMISTASWVNGVSAVSYERTNLSFASKFMHFQSNRSIPIYDSYIWIVMNGYFHKAGMKLTIGNPRNYSDFYERFVLFKEKFGLVNYKNYDIDKFLWQYGKQLLNGIRAEKQIDLEKAKAELRKRLRVA
jgi:hypothetical protein